MEKYDSALRVFAALSTTLLVIVLTCVPPSSDDFWLQARIGQLILDTRAVPTTLVFPFTEAQHTPFNAHEWLPSVVFHLLDRLLGEDLLVLVLGFFGLLFFLLSARLVWSLTHSLAASLLAGFGGIAVANFRHLLRPELFALTLLLLLLHVLLGYRATGRRAYLLWTLPIALVWANSHGSFLLGPFVAGLFALGEGLGALIDRRRSGRHAAPKDVVTVSIPYLTSAFGMVVVSLLNPLGTHLFDFVWSLSMSDVTKAMIIEWTPTLSDPFMAAPAFAMFAVWLGLSAVLCALQRRHLRPAEILLLIAFAVLALQRNRFVVFFGFASLPAVAQAIGSSLRAEAERALLVAVSVTASMGLALALRFGNFFGAYPYFVPSNHLSYPMRAVIANPEFKGNVFNSYELGSELIYRAWPRLKPSIDLRIDSYGNDYFLDQYRMLTDEQRLRAFVDRYDVRYMLLLWRDFETVKTMTSLRQSGWKMVFADHKMVLLQRSGT